jgi:23S rRNA pseudouridine2605 synthase
MSFGDRGYNSGSREEKPWGARRPYSPKPGNDRRSGSSGEGRGNFNPNRSSDRRESFDNTRRPYGNSSSRPQRDQGRFQSDGNRPQRDGNRAPRDGNRDSGFGNRTPRDGNRASSYGNRAPGYGNRNSSDGNRSESGSYNREYRDKPKFRNDKTRAPFKKFSKPKKSAEENIPIKREFNDAGEMRLNRYLAHAGICSRRQADDYIKAGLVTVNGTVITEMGVKIKKGDDIRYNGERLATEKKVYILVNKPKDYVTSTDDELGRKTVLDLVADACPERVYPVGRLDRNTTGVILLTNDGDLAGKLTHPKYNKKKIYQVVLDKNLKQADLKSITEGITLEDGFIQPDAISIIKPDKKNEIGIEIHSGRNRIVRRIFEQLGYEIVRLDRVYFAGLTKKNLARGKWRFLSEKEITMLQMNSYE